METFDIKTANGNTIRLGIRTELTDAEKCLNPFSERYTLIAETYGGRTRRKAVYIPLIGVYSYISPATFMHDEEEAQTDITSVEEAIDQFFTDVDRDLGPHCRYWGFVDEFSYR